MTRNKKILLILGAIIFAVAVISVCLFAFGNKEKLTYTVTFDSDGGTVISKQIIYSGEKIKMPTDPTKEGYIFGEWLLNGKLFDFSTPIEKNITLVAKWQENSPEKQLVKIKFNSDGGTTIPNEIIEKGSKVIKPLDPTKDGYKFVGWQLSSVEYNFDNEVVEDLELTAKWEKNKATTNSDTSNNNNTSKPSTNTTPTVKKYTVTFNSNGGSGVSAQQITEGEKASKPSNPTKSGYTFAGWTLNGSAYDFNSAVRGNITLVAGWNAKVYTVTVSNVDSYSPDRILTVYEDEIKINVSAIAYNGTTLCSGSDMIVNRYEIEGISTVTIILNDGSSVTARID